MKVAMLALLMIGCTHVRTARQAYDECQEVAGENSGVFHECVMQKLAEARMRAAARARQDAVDDANRQAFFNNLSTRAAPAQETTSCTTVAFGNMLQTVCR